MVWLIVNSFYPTAIGWWLELTSQFSLLIWFFKSHWETVNPFSFHFSCFRCNSTWRSYLCCGRPWWLELSEYSGEVGPPESAMDICSQYVHCPKHSWCGSIEWQVSRFFFFYLSKYPLSIVFKINLVSWLNKKLFKYFKIAIFFFNSVFMDN